MTTDASDRVDQATRLGELLKKGEPNEFNQVRKENGFGDVKIDLTLPEGDPYRLEDIDLGEFNLTEVAIVGVDFSNCSLGPTLKSCVFRDCEFWNCRFTSNTAPYGLLFTDCRFTNCTFRDFDFGAFEVSGCTFRGDQEGEFCEFYDCSFADFSAKSNAFIEARVHDSRQAEILKRLVQLGIRGPKRVRKKKGEPKA